MHEAKGHESNSFLTLTYDPAHMPIDGSLNVEHWKLFAKRARNHFQRKAKKEGRNPESFRYFHCGEYGDLFGRPHYHACIFGVDFNNDRKIWTISHGNILYCSDLLNSLWGKGKAFIGEVTFESAAYVARYAMKKVTGKKAEEYYQGRKPEYITMSRRPGIGSLWYGKFGEEVARDDFVIVNGQKTRPPKYYDELLGEKNPKRLEELKRRRVSKARDHEWNNTYKRLRVREEVLVRKIEQLKRSLEV